ncbi:endonuclease/exonuclease/phosphatase family protein [Maribacter sp. 2308TA10-17]|uniref:endonuclease/exonuclease/phosphatase family protein n=1 Tax=Maribacter sp. 2308TA10-17 TaxID=3386276 RepID=UPI0039BD52F8
MKPLSLINKILFACNLIAALLLLLACAVPHVSDGRFSFLSFLSLTVPLLVGFNFFFFLYWLLKRRKQVCVSVFVLVFGYFSLGTFIKFKLTEEEILEDDLSIMSYNVRSFNRYDNLDVPNVFEKVKAFVDQEQPDIICFQEPGYLRKNEYLDDYPYHYLDYIYMKGKVLLGFYSKYPIVKFDMVCFPDSANNAAFIDVLYKKDTIRIYNVHLQSLGITPGKGIIKNKPKDKLFKMLNKRFKIQQQQAKMLEESMKANNYKQIVCGDFNNTQFSNAYKVIKGEKQDTFIEQGTGYDRTLLFHGLPVRIDFILADPEFKVKSHKNYDVKYSDHYPTMASLELKSD